METPPEVTTQTHITDWHTIKPVQDWVIIRPLLRPAKSKGGVELPNSYEQSDQGVIVITGPWCQGVNLPKNLDINNIIRCKPNDMVLFNPQMQTTYNEGFPQHHFVMARSSFIRGFVEMPKTNIITRGVA